MEWNAMLVLGAYHGINPGMGWLFAVALGMQQGNVRGVFGALPPIALGHAVAVGVVVLAAGLAGLVVPISALKIAVASILMMLGLHRLWRHRHPRFGGMQVGFRDLTVWSFLMASTHGAGFMVLPFVLGVPAVAASEHAEHMVARDTGVPWTNAMAVGIHTLVYLLVTALVACVVYRKLGLRLLRTAWINLDWLWAGALVITGAVVLLTSRAPVTMPYNGRSRWRGMGDHDGVARASPDARKQKSTSDRWGVSDDDNRCHRANADTAAPPRSLPGSQGLTDCQFGRLGGGQHRMGADHTPAGAGEEWSGRRISPRMYGAECPSDAIRRFHVDTLSARLPAPQQ